MRFVLVLALVVAAAAAAATPARSAAGATQTVVLTIRPMPHQMLDRASWQNVKERLAPDERVTGSNFAVRPGVLVRVVVLNYTDELHSFTSPELGVNVAILPGSVDTPAQGGLHVRRAHGRADQLALRRSVRWVHGRQRLRDHPLAQEPVPTIPA